MKRLAIALFIVLIPAAFLGAQDSPANPMASLFKTEFGLGSELVYWGDIADIGQNGLNAAELGYGAEVRVKLFMMRADASLILESLDSANPRFLLPVDVGYSFDLGSLRLGLLVGENLRFDPAADAPLSLITATPFNLKASADFLLGKTLSFGVEAYYLLADFSSVTTLAFLKKTPILASAVQFRF